jgi:hypothetical protein
MAVPSMAQSAGKKTLYLFNDFGRQPLLIMNFTTD